MSKNRLQDANSTTFLCGPPP